MFVVEDKSNSFMEEHVRIFFYKFYFAQGGIYDFTLKFCCWYFVHMYVFASSRVYISLYLLLLTFPLTFPSIYLLTTVII